MNFKLRRYIKNRVLKLVFNLVPIGGGKAASKRHLALSLLTGVILSLAFVIALLIGNFLLKLQDMFYWNRLAILANFAWLHDSLAMKLVNEIHELFCFIFLLRSLKES